ncbi:MAG: hypothetical protein J5J06_02835 [Phycisphaerae bacterium]|nr:hypothetical protein [Phycisphaerae bacterium]
MGESAGGWCIGAAAFLSGGHVIARFRRTGLRATALRQDAGEFDEVLGGEFLLVGGEAVVDETYEHEEGAALPEIGVRFGEAPEGGIEDGGDGDLPVAVGVDGNFGTGNLIVVGG